MKFGAAATFIDVSSMPSIGNGPNAEAVVVQRVHFAVYKGLVPRYRHESIVAIVMHRTIAELFAPEAPNE